MQGEPIQLGGENLFGSEQLTQLEQRIIQRKYEPLGHLSVDDQLATLTKRAELISSDVDLRDLLLKVKGGEEVHVKFGIDPTGPELHLGHTSCAIVVDRLRRMGIGVESPLASVSGRSGLVKIDFVIGDFTAAVGDPSGRSTSRPVLTRAQIEDNFASYKRQIAPFLDLDYSEVQVYNNSIWLNGTSLQEFFPILNGINLATLMQRDDLRGRGGIEGINVGELMYSILMGLDSVHLETDLEVGGKDQFLNFQMCRSVMRSVGLVPETFITQPILLGTGGDGRKMSKSFGNHIPANTEPAVLRSAILHLPDSLMETYFKALTEIYDEEWDQLSQMVEQGVHPNQIKTTLANILVGTIYKNGIPSETGVSTDPLIEPFEGNLSNLQLEEALNGAVAEHPETLRQQRVEMLRGILFQVLGDSLGGERNKAPIRSRPIVFGWKQLNRALMDYIAQGDNFDLEDGTGLKSAQIAGILRDVLGEPLDSLRSKSILDLVLERSGNQNIKKGGRAMTKNMIAQGAVKILDAQTQEVIGVIREPKQSVGEIIEVYRVKGRKLQFHWGKGVNERFVNIY